MDYWTANMKRPLQDWRLKGAPGRVVAMLAQEVVCPQPDCGWDEFSQSAKRVDCPVCHGQGKVLTFDKRTIRARVVWANTYLNYLAVTSGVEMGDVSLGIERPDVETVNLVMAQERSYLLVDSKAVRPTSVSPMVIPGVEDGFQVICNVYTPESRR